MSDIFADQTENTLNNCGEWLQKHSRELAEHISGGCKDWTIVFRSGDDGLFPFVYLEVHSLDTEKLVAPYETADFVEEPPIVTSEYGFAIEKQEEV